MTDKEIIDYCLEKMNGLKNDQRKALYKIVMAIKLPNHDPQTFEANLEGTILEKPKMEHYVEGMPFEALFFLPQWNLMLGEFFEIPAPQRPGKMTAREKALEKTITYLETNQKQNPR